MPERASGGEGWTMARGMDARLSILTLRNRRRDGTSTLDIRQIGGRRDDPGGVRSIPRTAIDPSANEEVNHVPT